MSAARIAVAAPGEPRDPRTWSGTSAAVLSALERRGLEVAGIDCRMRGFGRKLFHYARYQGWRAMSALAGDGPFLTVNGSGAAVLFADSRADYRRMRRARRSREAAMLARARELGVESVVHMGGGAVPLTASGMRHFLYCDSTWHSYLANPGVAERYGRRIRQAFSETEREGYAQVEHFFPISEYVRDDLVEHYGIDANRVTVAGTGFRQFPPAGEKDYGNGEILFVAKVLFEMKGGPLLLEGFRLARRENPRLKLTVVGQKAGGAIREMEGLTVRGFVPLEELHALYQRASLFAMPALAEPWGLVYLEAMAAAIPVLGLRRNALPEMTMDGRFGFLVEEATPRAVADGLLDAMSSPERLRRMGEEGRAHCQAKYSWDRTAAVIAEVVAR